MQKLLLLSLLLSFAHADPVYRWRDAQGKTHYGETIPANIPYEQLNEKNLPPAHVMPATKSFSKTAKKIRRKVKNPKTHRSSNNTDAALKRCRRYEEQLENIGNRLREGYREPTGNRLRAKRRQLEQRVHDEC